MPLSRRIWAKKHEAGEYDDDSARAVVIEEYERRIAELERKVGQLTMELELAKRGALEGERQRARELVDHFGTCRLSRRARCEVIRLPRSTYYYRTRDRQAKLAEDASLIGRLSALSKLFPRYGYRRMTGFR